MHSRCLFFFFFNDTATTEIYTLSLHDALPISLLHSRAAPRTSRDSAFLSGHPLASRPSRSEEHTSELQSRLHLVCRLLLEKKKKKSSLPSLPLSNYHLVRRYATQLTRHHASCT